MKLLICTICFAICAAVLCYAVYGQDLIQLPNDTAAFTELHDVTYVAYAERTYERVDPPGFFIIAFCYNTQSCMVPMTNPPGKVHYSAMISVYEVMDGKKVLVVPEFEGMYIEGGCFEDDSEMLVSQAIKIRDEKQE